MIIETIKQVVISNGVGKTGKPWTRYSFDCESGKKYSTFNIEIGDKFKAGDHVQIEGEQDGRFFNMKSMKLWEGSQTPTIPVEKPRFVEAVTKADTIQDIIQNSIQRQCALKAAVEFQKNNDECTGDEILVTANKFVEWINGN